MMDIIQVKLPACERAFVESIKLTEYLLHDEKSKGKSHFFTAIGFTLSDYSLLANSLLRLACSGEVVKITPTQFGVKYTVTGLLENPFNRSVRVLSVWMIDTGNVFPRFVTAYPD